MINNFLIIGGSASVAPEIIKLAAREALKTIVTFRNPPHNLNNENTEYIKCDLNDVHDRKSLVGELSKFPDGIDAVLILVGAILGKNLENTQDEEMTELINSNLLGPIQLIRDILPVLKAGARVVLVSSVSGQRGSFDPLYAATKGALIPFAKSLATWLGKKFTITVVAPGAIEDSCMVSGMSMERIEFHRNASPTGSLLKKEDFAKILIDIAKPYWAHSNGSVISLNGGSYV